MTTTDPHRRILVVDDDDDVRSMLVTALRQKALNIDEAAGGRRALELLHEHPYSVVILDLLMPETDGFAVLRNMEQDTVTPVVLVVSGAERPVLNLLDVRRIHGIIRKPFDPEELADIVAACAEIRSRSAFETMAIATVISGAPLLALLKM